MKATETVYIDDGLVIMGGLIMRSRGLDMILAVGDDVC